MNTNKLVNVMSQDLSYCEPKLKNSFHSESKKVLKELSRILGIEKECKISSNKAGIACSGEISLHGDSIYIVISQFFGGEEVLYRGCDSRQNSVSTSARGHNQYCKITDLFTEHQLSKFKKLSRIN
ncbi:hypothetical protein V6259_19355 [Marinomonas sp. TI.3.20]|uniref:hypothetical protein n=1 Tax=Marinomonas sp. TI.3.20 TaxID=3121296 RepID=UPI00311D9032